MVDYLTKNIFKVTIEDPIKKKIIQKLLFFWDLPQNVKKTIDTRKFDSKILNNYYGKSWKSLLEINFIGGDDVDDFEFDENIEITLNKTKLPKQDYSDKIRYITNMVVFLEDTMLDLKNKISIITGIPVYRQYLFQKDPNETIHSTQHKVRIFEDTEYPIDETKDDTEFYGFKIDGTLVNNSENITTFTNEMTTMLDALIFDELYLWDLDFYKKALNIEQVLDNKYQIKMFYNGIIRKYFPMLDLPMLVLYLSDEESLYSQYPLINQPMNFIKDKYEYQQKKLVKMYNKTEEYSKFIRDKLEFYISHFSYASIKNNYPDNYINIRNVLDVLKTNENILLISAHIKIKDNKYRINKFYANSDPYIQESVEYVDSDQEILLEDKLYIYYKTELNGYFNLFTISSNGDYSGAIAINKKKMLFKDAIETDSLIINPIIDTINNQGGEIFNSNYGKILKFDINNIRLFDHIEIEIHYQENIDVDKFKKFGDIIDEYSKYGLITRRDNIHQKTSNNHILKLVKGTSRNVESFSLKKNTEVSDYYIALRDININKIWNDRYSGRIFNIYNEYSRMILYIDNIDSISFVSGLRVIALLLDELNDIKDVKKTNEKKEFKTKKKMEELDPDLYTVDFKGNKKYARVCQKKFRPKNVYQEHELTESDKKKPTIHKFKSYTTGEPLYYECPNNLQDLSFTIDIHPKDYCVPRCRQKGSEGKKGTMVNTLCYTQESVSSKDLGENTSKLRHPIKFGKTLDVRRISHLHEYMYTLGFSKQYYLYKPDISFNTEVENIFGIIADKQSVTQNMIITDIVDQLNDEAFMKLNLEYHIEIADLKQKLLNITKGIIANFKWKGIIEQLIYVIYGITLVTFEVISLKNEEILTAKNSFVNLILNKNLPLSDDPSQYLFVVDINDEYLPIVWDYDEYKYDVKIVNGIKNYISKKRKKTNDSIFNDLNNIKKTTKIKEVYLNENKIKYAICGYGGKTICIGVNDSVKESNTAYKQNTNPFNRVKYNLDVAVTLKFIMKNIPLDDIVFVCQSSKLYEIKRKEDKNKCNFIGCRVEEDYFWFNNTSYNVLRKITKHDFKIELLNYEPHKISKLIQSSQIKKYSQDGKLFYDMNIYKLFKSEIYKIIAHYKDPKIYKQISLFMNKVKKKELLLKEEVRKTLPYSYSIIIDALDNDKDPRTIIINENYLVLFQLIQDINKRKMIDSIAKKICVFSNTVTSKDPPNMISSAVDVDVKFKSITNIEIKHRKSKKESNMFYINGKLNIEKSIYESLLDNLELEFGHELTFITNIMNPINYIVNNEFEFNVEENEYVKIFAL